MTLAEKIIKQLRQNKDGGLNSEHLASAIATKVEKVEAAARSLQEQEHLLLGSDGCWYLGDALAAGGKYEPPPKAPEPVLEKITLERPAEPFAIEEADYAQLEMIAQLREGVETDEDSLRQAICQHEPIRVRMKNWVHAQPASAKPISWSQLGRIIDAKRSAMGKARQSLLDRGEVDLVARLDRLVYREDSISYRQRAALDVTEIGEAANLTADLEEINARLQTQPPPPKWREYRGALLELDKILAQHLHWKSDRPLRKTLHEVCEWLEQAGGQL